MSLLDKILSKAINNKFLTDEEIAFLLDLNIDEQRKELFKAARKMREKYFKNKIFLYGFVYFSTYCRNKCNFCYYRKENNNSIRYRKSLDEILAIADALKKSGVHLLDLTMGEDPYFLSRGREGYNELIEIVKAVKEKTKLPLMISPGIVPKDVLNDLSKVGANWYACYQETHSIDLYKKMRVEQSYEERWNIKVFAKKIGMLVEEGLLTGIGDTTGDILLSLKKMNDLKADQVRVMTFVPQKGTPLEHKIVQSNIREINLIAVMRLLFPNKLIPASLDVEGINGLKERLNAGANVVTSIIPPKNGLAGVSQSTLDISEGYRTVSGVVPILNECGLEKASLNEYRNWIGEKLI